MSINVLIVEDNPVARSFLSRVVCESFSDQIDITEAGDLEAARRCIALKGGASAQAAVSPGGSLAASSPSSSSATASAPAPASLSGSSSASPSLAASASSPASDAASNTFKLILVDLELPDGNGMELLAELVRYPATKIVTTLYSDDDHLFPALQRGADGYLLKEDRFEVLVEELQKIVRGQPPLSPAIARRLLTHFRHGVGVTATAGHTAEEPPPSAFQSSRPMPLGKGPKLDHEELTPRESEVLTYLSKGFTIKEIASLMGIKWFTVNDHIKSIYKKLNVSSRAEAAVLASKHGLV